MTKKSEVQKMADAITLMVSTMTKDFEKIGLANQFVQSPLRQANRKLTEISELIGFVEYRKNIERADEGENGSGDTRTNTDQQERQIGWKVAECKELGESYALLKEAMELALDRAPFENDWVHGIVDGSKGLKG